MGKTIWGLFYVWVKMMLLRCEIEPQGSPRGQGPPKGGNIFLRKRYMRSPFLA